MLPSFVPKTADNRYVTKFFLMVFNTNSYFYIVHIYLLLKLHIQSTPDNSNHVQSA